MSTTDLNGNGAENPRPHKIPPASYDSDSVKDRRRTYRELLDQYASAPQRSIVSAEAVVHNLLIELIELDELVNEERAILEEFAPGKASSSSSELLKLEDAVLKLTRISDELVSKTNELPPGFEKHLPRDNTLNEYTVRLVTRDKATWEDRNLLPALRRKIAIHVTGINAARTRLRREPPEELEATRHHRGRLSTANAPTNLYSPSPFQHHDVLVIAPEEVHGDEEFFRFPVIKKALSNSKGPAAASSKAVSDAPRDPERVGQYRDKPELLDAFDDGQRRVLSVARPHDWGPASVRATQRGPAFATLPLKPEPEPAAGAESCMCYLINAQNLNFRNAWTAEEWNDTPGGVDLPPAQGAAQNETEALLAGPQGKVFRLLLTQISEWKPGTTARIVATNKAGDVQRDLGAIESVNLAPHMEVWHQLRGGTAMGRVYFDDDAKGPRVIPLVNITTLTRD